MLIAFFLSNQFYMINLKIAKMLFTIHLYLEKKARGVRQSWINLLSDLY